MMRGQKNIKFFVSCLQYLKSCSCHEGVACSGSMAPRVHNFCTRRRWLCELEVVAGEKSWVEEKVKLALEQATKTHM